MVKKYDKDTYFKNRELSWIDFNGRVLEEARDANNPLLERVNFLGITQSNVDEFFMVRVASLSKMVAVKITSTDASGMTPKAQLEDINKQEHDMVAKRYSTYNRSLLPLLNKEEIRLLDFAALSEEQIDFCQNYFENELSPFLTPMAVDSSRPFPFISNNSLNLAVRLQDSLAKKNTNLYAIVRLPENFSRLVKLPGGDNDFILLEEIIKAYLSQLFDGYQVNEAACFRVIRDMDLDVAEKDSSDLLKAVQNQLKAREHGGVVRLEVENSMSADLQKRLLKKLAVNQHALYQINGPIDLAFLKKWPHLITGHDDLRYPPFLGFLDPALSMDNNIFQSIQQKDFLLQHPYDSFDAVTNFIHQAAIDPQVLAIKMTLYRVSGNSPIINISDKLPKAASK